jgi:hypothetical protein
MRLPVVTPQQKQHEDSRQFNEALYAASQSGRRIIVTATPDTVQAVQLSLSSNTRHFWVTRGYRIRTAIAKDRQSVAVWLEVERRVRPLPRGRNRNEDDLIWQQRTA